MDAFATQGTLDQMVALVLCVHATVIAWVVTIVQTVSLAATLRQGAPPRSIACVSGASLESRAVIVRSAPRIDTVLADLRILHALQVLRPMLAAGCSKTVRVKVEARATREDRALRAKQTPFALQECSFRAQRGLRPRPDPWIWRRAPATPARLAWRHKDPATRARLDSIARETVFSISASLTPKRLSTA